jgi:hypothetical protein
MYTSCVLWVAPLCAFSIYFTYIKKKIPESALDDPTYDKLEAENSTILSWLLHSMHLDIS